MIATATIPLSLPDVRDLTFGDLYEALTAGFIVVLGMAAIALAPNDLSSIVKWLGYSTVVASFLAACLAVAMWIVIEAAG